MFYAKEIYPDFQIDYFTNNAQAAKSLGCLIEVADIEQAYNGLYYVAGHAPVKPAPTKEEQSASREIAYQQEVDPITCHINRLMDEQQTDEVAAEIEALKAERAEKVAAIKAQYPYPEGVA